MSREKNWGWPYYGAVDTTVKNADAITKIALDEDSGGLGFLNETYEGLDGKKHTVEEALNGHINWIRRRMGMNPEGLVESLDINPRHHPNKTWADSPDAFFHADGSWPEHHPDKGWGVASVELQADVYDTLLGARDDFSCVAAAALLGPCWPTSAKLGALVRLMIALAADRCLSGVVGSDVVTLISSSGWVSSNVAGACS